MYSLFVKHYLFKQIHFRGNISEKKELNLINAESNLAV